MLESGFEPVGLQPTDSIRGHPRLGAVETKAWMRGSSPRKTTLSRSHGVKNKRQLQENFPRTGLAFRRDDGVRPVPRFFFARFGASANMNPVPGITDHARAPHRRGGRRTRA